MENTITKRQRVERKIARRLILDGLAAGYTITVDNGEEQVLRQSTKCKAILDAMFSVDDERLIFHKDGEHIGWVWFVYGNDGWDVISDYSVSLEHIMAGANKLSEEYQ